MKKIRVQGSHLAIQRCPFSKVLSNLVRSPKSVMGVGSQGTSGVMLYARQELMTCGPEPLKVLCRNQKLWLLYSTHGYYGSTHGYYGTIGIRVRCSTHGYYIVPKTGYYRVLHAYAAEGMSSLRLIGLGLGFAYTPARYLTYL
jgi:hypothetical protein